MLLKKCIFHNCYDYENYHEVTIMSICFNISTVIRCDVINLHRDVSRPTAYYERSLEATAIIILRSKYSVLIVRACQQKKMHLDTHAAGC